MDKFVEAVEVVKAELLAGRTPSEAIAAGAEDTGLKELAVKNRAELALGDLATYADRKAEQAKADAESVAAGDVQRAKRAEQAAANAIAMREMNAMMQAAAKESLRDRLNRMTPAERHAYEHNKALNALLKALTKW